MTTYRQAGPGAAPSASRVGALAALRRFLPATGLGVVLAYIVLVPLAVLLWSSFTPTGLIGDGGFTLDNYQIVYSDPRTYQLLATSLAFSVGSTAVALVVGIAVAWLVERTDMPGRRVFRVLVILPLAIPPVLLAISWVLLASPKIGLLNGALHAIGLTGVTFDIYSLGGMIFVQGLSLVPTTYLVLAPAFRNMDPSLEEAALASGAHPLRVIRKVIIPVVRPAILAAGAFLFIVGFVVFDIPGILGLPVGIYVLSSQIFFESQPPSGLPNYGQISALVVVFLVILILLSWLYNRQTRQAQRFVTVTGKGFRPRAFRLGRWKWLATLVVAAYALLAVIAPLGVLLWTSLMPYYSGFSLSMLSKVTLKNHIQLASNPLIGQAIVDSVVIAVVAATVVALLSALISWFVVRSKLPGRKVIDAMAFLPQAIPAVMIGLALVYVYLNIKFLPIFGSIWIIAIAMITVYISFGTRVTNGVLAQIHSELEEAAGASGAGWGRTFRRVTLPLIRPALLGVWVWVAANSMRELSAALMLQGANNQVIPTVLWGFWENGQPTTAAAAGVWLIVALLVLMIIWDRLSPEAGSVGKRKRKA